MKQWQAAYHVIHRSDHSAWPLRWTGPLRSHHPESCVGPDTRPSTQHLLCFCALDQIRDDIVELPMSHIKQIQQTRQLGAKSTHLTDRSQGGRAHGPSKSGATQTMLRSLSTRAEAKHTDTGRAPPSQATLDVGSINILKRSLSKLRIRESPTKQNVVQPSRQPLQPASKIPQSKAPVPSARILGARPDRSAFVVHPLAPAKQNHTLHRDYSQKSNLPHQHHHQEERIERQEYVPTTNHLLSPSADQKSTEVRKKAMQLGIFKISEADLKERYQFLNEIGKLTNFSKLIS